jgi:hypothetical protein
VKKVPEKHRFALSEVERTFSAGCDRAWIPPQGAVSPKARPDDLRGALFAMSLCFYFSSPEGTKRKPAHRGFKPPLPGQVFGNL